MVKIKLTGRLGNQMFQFAFAYLAAKKKKDFIIIQPASHFGYCLDVFRLPFIAGGFPRRMMLLINRLLVKIFKPTSKLSFLSCFYSLQIPEIKGITEIEGYFQDGKSWTPYRAEMLKLFSIRSEIRKRFEAKYSALLNKKLLVFNVRLGNYKQAFFEEIQSHGLLPKEWYLNALSTVDIQQYDHLLVISDEVGEVRKNFGLDQYDPIYIDDGMETDFQFMMHADCLILSNSTFSWWAAFLNERPEKRIIAPKYWVGYHVKKEYPSGIIPDDWEQL
jgi:hypothetical protein